MNLRSNRLSKLGFYFSNSQLDPTYHSLLPVTLATRPRVACPAPPASGRPRPRRRSHPNRPDVRRVDALLHRQVLVAKQEVPRQGFPVPGALEDPGDALELEQGILLPRNFSI